jgi:hypothetical protein
MSALARAYYLRASGRYKARAAAGKLRVLAANRRALRELLASRACADCGLQDLTVLEFDHRRDKRNHVSDLVRRAASWGLIAREIAKCDVVCADCHRRRTAARAGWYRLGEPCLDLPPLPAPDAPDYARIKNVRHVLRRRHASRTHMLAYLRARHCSDCGVTDPILLEFDHLGEKTASVSALLTRGSWPRILREIAACEVVCANCHRRRTAARAGRDR